MSKKSVITIIMLVGAVAVGMKGKALLKQRQAQVANEATPQAMQISVPVVYGKNGELSQDIKALATIQAKKSIKLSTKLAGYVKEVLVKESDSVKQGELLIRIDNKELLASLQSLTTLLKAQENDIKLAKSIYERNLKLYKIGGLSKEQLDTSRVGLEMKTSIVDNTKSKIEQINNQLSYMDIKAPFDGVVDSIFLHQGDLAVASKPIVMMSSLDKKLMVSFSTNLLDTIKEHQQVFYNGEMIGEIKSIYPTATNALAMAEVKLEQNLSLPNGANIELDIQTRKDMGCVLPDSTIWHKKDGEYILVYKDKKFIANKVDIKVASSNKVLLDECPKYPIANASQAKYSTLLAYDNVELIGDKNGAK